MTKMQNNEYRRKIAELEEQNKELKAKQIKAEFKIEEVSNDLFVKNDTLKLFDKTIEDLTTAIEVEKIYDEELNNQIKHMKELLYEEQTQRDEYKNLQIL